MMEGEGGGDRGNNKNGGREIVIKGKKWDGGRRDVMQGSGTRGRNRGRRTKGGGRGIEREIVGARGKENEGGSERGGRVHQCSA